MNVGDKIPEILGIDQDGREIKASDFRGRKIVLYSYPKANTSGCTAEACSLQAHKEELAAAGYEIIGVSKDKQALRRELDMLLTTGEQVSVSLMAMTLISMGVSAVSLNAYTKTREPGTIPPPSTLSSSLIPQL